MVKRCPRSNAHPPLWCLWILCLPQKKQKKTTHTMMRWKEEVSQHTVASCVCSCAFFMDVNEDVSTPHDRDSVQMVYPEGLLDAHTVCSHICMPVSIDGGWRVLHSNIFFFFCLHVPCCLSMFPSHPVKHAGISNGVTVDPLWWGWTGFTGRIVRLSSKLIWCLICLLSRDIFVWYAKWTELVAELSYSSTSVWKHWWRRRKWTF